MSNLKTRFGRKKLRCNHMSLKSQIKKLWGKQMSLKCQKKRTKICGANQCRSNVKIKKEPKFAGQTNVAQMSKEVPTIGLIFGFC